MSLAAVAAAATVYDDIDDVARDTGLSASVARVVVVQNDFASVDDDGRVTMSPRQSMVAARAIANVGGAW